MPALLETLARQSTPAQPGAARRLWRHVPLQTRVQIQSLVTRLLAPLPDREARGGFPLGIALGAVAWACIIGLIVLL